jgi:hypothetical protein
MCSVQGIVASFLVRSIYHISSRVTLAHALRYSDDGCTADVGKGKVLPWLNYAEVA